MHQRFTHTLPPPNALQTYMTPLRNGVVKMKTHVHMAIFGNIDALYTVHSEILERMEEAVAQFPRISLPRMLLDRVCIS